MLSPPSTSVQNKELQGRPRVNLPPTYLARFATPHSRPRPDYSTAMSSRRPIIVISHGAWHHPACYKPFISLLKAHGYTVLVPPLATAGPDDSIIGKSHRDDVNRIHEVLLPHLDAGKQAIIVGHSYGGIPATTCCMGHTTEERADRGLSGGIKAVVYVAAYAPLVAGKALHDFDTIKDFFDVDVSSCVEVTTGLR